MSLTPCIFVNTIRIFNLYLALLNLPSFKCRVDKTIAISAKALFIKSNGTIEWKTANIIDYREEDNSYLAKWNDTKETKWLQR